MSQIFSPAVPDRVVERALDSLVMGHNGCHVSSYSVGSHGYAQIGWQDDARKTQMVLVHRLIWVYRTGKPIPPGLVLDHFACQNRRCSNIDHLRLLTRSQNAARARGRDWPLDECANGHKLADHWYRYPGSAKGYCRVCSNKVKNKSPRKAQQRA